jgi:hypothetical protein
MHAEIALPPCFHFSFVETLLDQRVAVSIKQTDPLVFELDGLTQEEVIIIEGEER